MEGWLYNRPGIKEVIAEYKKGGYTNVISVGMFIENRMNKHKCYSSAELAAGKLKKLGLIANITTITAPYEDTHRTYNMGLALRNYFQPNPDKSGNLNILTIGVHARKSRRLFQTALGESYTVGVISAKENCYDRDRWWVSGTGIRLVTRNTTGYLYSLIFSAYINLKKLTGHYPLSSNHTASMSHLL